MREKTASAALCGMMAAVSVVILLIGALLGLGTYAAPMLAGLCLLPVGARLGRKQHALMWLAVSLLGLMLVPDVEEILMYLCLFGPYPILYPLFGKLKGWLRMAAKLLYFNAVVAVLEFLLMKFLLPEAMRAVTAGILLLLGNVTFVCYDRLIPLAEAFLQRRIGRFFDKIGTKR